jgi:putative acetyltransferase
VRRAQINIRPERAGDEGAIDRVESSAFPTRAEAELVRAIRASGAAPCISLVAEIDGRVVGHALFTPVSVQSDLPWHAMALGPIGVEPAHQRCGVGSALLRAGLTACRALGHHVVFVLGHPEYYARFGFMPAHARGLRWERLDEPSDAFMVVELAPGALAGRRGVVRYLSAFDDV